MATEGQAPEPGAAAPPEPLHGLQRFNPKQITGSAPFFPLLVLFGLNAVDELDRGAFSLLLPDIRDHFGLSLTGVTTLLAVVGIAGLLLEIPIAYIGDRYNRVRLATIGAAIWGLFTAASGLVWNVGGIYATRIGSSFGRLFNATHNSLVSDYYPPESRVNAFYFYNFANSVGQFVTPALAGVLALYLTWRAPFILFAIPTFVVVLFALRLKEPKRGVHERLAAGADQATAETEEEPPTISETFRVLFNNKSARRIYFSLPFFTAATIAAGPILSLFWADVYNLNPAQRGLLQTVTEPIQVVGLLVGAKVLQKVVSRDPGLALKLIGATIMISAAANAGIALSPNLVVATGFRYFGAFASATLLPGIIAVLSLAVPPRMRTLAFATGNLWFLLGYMTLPIVGGFGDRFGLRVGLLMVVPINIVGGILLGSAGSFLNIDIHKVRVSALAQAEARKARQEGRAKMLLVRGLDTGYDGVQVLFAVDFEVDDGEVVALLGTNGSGKSTLLKAITGILEPYGGAIIFDGHDITSADPVRIAQRGIAMVPGGRAIFPTLSVADNMRVAGWLYRRDPKYVQEATEKVLEHFPILRERWDQSAGSLSGGEQQMLSLAQAFIARPKLLCIDELTLGLAPTIVERLLAIVKAIAEGGTTIILVEQSVNTALRLAKRAVFMEKGEVRFAGLTTELLQRPDILRSVYLQGAQALGGAGQREETKASALARSRSDDLEKTISFTDRPVVLETRGLTKRYGGITAVSDVSLKLYEGEILGLIGPNGAGKTTLFDLITGFVTPDAGRVYLHGTDVTGKLTSQRAKLGLGRSFQDARLWPALTVREVISVALERSIDERSPVPAMFGFPGVWDSERDVERRAEELVDLLGLGAFGDKFISELSTGSRRIVEIACMLAHRPSVLILDEPSSGIAQRETEALGPMLRQVRDYMNCSLLVIEHSMPLITTLAHRMIALDAGMYVTEGTPQEVITHPAVVESYLGAADYDHLLSDDDEPAERPPRTRTATRKKATTTAAARKKATTATRRRAPRVGGL